MARMACPQLPGVPLHLVLRRDAVDPAACLERLRAATGCAVHAYVLMGTHAHLLLTPQGADGALPTMRALQARAFDATPVTTRRYILACMRYIELNPVRAGLVRHPAHYRWWC
jgi:putative transposase